MPLLVLLLVLIAIVALIPLLIPLSLILRYRAGTARRQARGWIAAINVIATLISTFIFLCTAAIMNIWVPRAFVYTILGLLGGISLGLIGLWMSKWEKSPEGLHFTPSRLLVLAITLVVTARIAYGIWRAFHETADVANTLGAGAVVLGYFLAYWNGVQRRIKRHRSA